MIYFTNETGSCKTTVQFWQKVHGVDITQDNVCSSMLSCFYSHLLSTGRPISSCVTVWEEILTLEVEVGSLLRAALGPKSRASLANLGAITMIRQLDCLIFMLSLCGVGVRVNNFFSKTTRPRDMLFFLKDTLSIEDEKLFKACKSVCSSVC